MGQIRFVTTRVFLDLRNLTAIAATSGIPKWSNYYICLRKTGYSLFLTSNEVVFTLRTPAGVEAPPSVFRMELLGAERNAQVSGTDKLPGVANYFIGNDPKKW